LDRDLVEPKAPPAECGDTGEDAWLEYTNWDKKLVTTEANPIRGGSIIAAKATIAPDD
jgi:hypothetical protein